MVSCCTDVYEFEFQWIIKRFSLQLKCAEKEIKEKLVLKSSTFSTGDRNNSTAWHLKLNLYGPEHKDRNFIGLYTVFECIDETVTTWAQQDYYFVDSAENKIKFRSASMNKFTADTPAWGFNHFYETEKLLENKNLYLPDDQLTIVCRITVIGLPTAMAVINSPKTIDIKSDLADDYAKLFLSERFSDVIFVLDDDARIPAHRTILMARSPLFATMFEDKVNDMVDDDVVIDDIDPDVFRELLHFIYTDEVSELENHAMALMSAAEEYGLEKLKDICLEYLYNHVTVDNATETLIIAERYGNEKLVEYTRKFINARINDADAVGLVDVNYD